jgi:hypothetical protein
MVLYEIYREDGGNGITFVHMLYNQSRPPFKMAAVTKNRNFFNCPLLLYYKSK